MSPSTSSPITSRPPQVEFTNRFVQPPSALYLFRDDQLFLRTQSSRNPPVEIFVRGRVLVPTGEIVTLEFVAASAINRVPQENTFDLVEGFLLGLVVLSSTTNIRRGELWVAAGITRGGTTPRSITQLLFTGYLEGMTSPSWPVSGIASSTAGAGRINNTRIASPGLGNELTFIVPGRVRWRIVSMHFTQSTSAVASSRFVVLEVLDIFGRSMFQSSPARALAANSLADFVVADFGTLSAQTGFVFYLPFPSNLILEPGEKVQTININGDVNDLFSIAELRVEEWLEGF